MKFKEALSKKALKKYDNLGKLIKLGKYYEPEEPNSVDYHFVNDPLGVNKSNYLKDMKEYHKELMGMRNDRPKLYALIYQYLSEKSQEEIKWSDKFEKINEETDPEGLWLLVEATHKVNTISKVEAVTKLAAQNAYQTIHHLRGNCQSYGRAWDLLICCHRASITKRNYPHFHIVRQFRGAKRAY